MWTLWLHPQLTTIQPELSCGRGEGPEEVQGAQSAKPCSRLAEGAREGLEVMHQALLPGV